MEYFLFRVSDIYGIIKIFTMVVVCFDRISFVFGFREKIAGKGRREKDRGGGERRRKRERKKERKGERVLEGRGKRKRDRERETRWEANKRKRGDPSGFVKSRSLAFNAYEISCMRDLSRYP